jgi:ABC-type nitrate/sulfonate/bicarbonate transport system ATPase subunit
MDEPFGSLDAQTRETLQEELSRILEQERKTMLFVTHSIDEAIYLGDRIVLMTPRPGRIREILSVGIPRPRDISQVRADTQAVRLRAYIWDRLKQDAEQSTKG